MGGCVCEGSRNLPLPEIFVDISSINEKEVNKTLEKRETRVKQFLKVRSLCCGKTKEFSSKKRGGQGGEISTEVYIKTKSQKVPKLRDYSVIERENWKEDKGGLIKQIPPIEKMSLPTTTTQMLSEGTTNNSDALQQSTQDISNVLISVEEEEKLKCFFKEHYLFHFFNEQYIQSIIDELPGFLLEKDSYIFKEGDESLCFFLIKSGKCLLIGDNETSELNEYEAFGELAICYQKTKALRAYSIKTLTHSEIFWIDASFYQSLRKTIINLPSIEDIIHYFESIMLFKYITDEAKEKLASLVSYNSVLKGKKFISKSSASNKDSIHIITQGQFSKKLLNGYTRYLYPGSVLNVNQVLLFSSLNKKKFEVEANEDTTCLTITKSAFIEVFGLAYQRSLLFQCFIKTIGQNSFLSLLMNKAGLEVSNLFKAFQIKEYPNNGIVFCKSALLNKKYVFIFEGELIKSKSNDPLCTRGSYYGDDITLRTEE